jgi:hypothetical protein
MPTLNTRVIAAFLIFCITSQSSYSEVSFPTPSLYNPANSRHENLIGSRFRDQAISPPALFDRLKSFALSLTCRTHRQTTTWAEGTPSPRNITVSGAGQGRAPHDALAGDQVPNRLFARHHPAKILEDRWLSLSKVSGWIRDDVKAAPHALKPAIRARYSSWLTDQTLFQGALVDAESRQTFQPARLDTVIHQQGVRREQAALEVASNSLDALPLELFTIGRFGVGVKQTLQWLEGPGDRVHVTSRAAGRPAYRLSYRLAGEYQVKSEQLPDGEVSGAGTQVEVLHPLSSQDQNDLAAYLETHLHLTLRAPIDLHIEGEPLRRLNPLHPLRRMNGRVVDQYDSESPILIRIGPSGWSVTDPGKGMDEQVLVESFIPGRQGTKKREIPDGAVELARDRAALHWAVPAQAASVQPSRLAFKVNDVVIHHRTIHGIQLPSTLAIELPPWSWLPEAKNDILLDEYTIPTFDALVDKVIDQSISNMGKASLLNGLYAAVNALALTEPSPEASQLLLSMRQRSRAWCESVQSRGEAVFLPSAETYLSFQVNNPLPRIFLHPDLVAINPVALGLESAPGWSSDQGYQLYLADFAGDIRHSPVVLEEQNILLLDRRYYVWLVSHPLRALLLNLLFGYWIGYGPKGSPKGILTSPGTSEVESAAPSSLNARVNRVLALINQPARDIPMGMYAQFSILVDNNPERSDEELAQSMKAVFSRITAVDKLLEKSGVPARRSSSMEDVSL